MMMAGLTACGPQALAETKYIATMSGVTWGGCKVDVRSALTEVFKATNITIEKGEDRKQLVKFTSDDKTITRSELKKAIDNKKYIVWRIKKDTTLPDQWPDGTWHLLLLEQHGPYIKA